LFEYSDMMIEKRKKQYSQEKLSKSMTKIENVCGKNSKIANHSVMFHFEGHSSDHTRFKIKTM